MLFAFVFFTVVLACVLAHQLTLNSLGVGYKSSSGEHVLFADLNMQIAEGEFVCLMGPNGSGKSTLLRTIAGLQPALQGSVAVLRGNARETAQPTNLSVVLTQRPNAGNMTAMELVSFGRYPHIGRNAILSEKDKRIVEEAIATIGITHLRESPLSQLSDGQMQMAMIARALAQETPVILLDEPTAHLDLNNRLEVMNVLKRLCRDLGKSILLSTHELDLALQTADSVWLAGTNKGLISGVPEDLVLNGSFDSIFQLKGFDLKTGKVFHREYRGTTIYVDGSGPEYLWTRNALERSGFKIAGVEENKGAAVIVKVMLEEKKPRWVLQRNNQQFSLTSIAELIDLV